MRLYHDRWTATRSEAGERAILRVATRSELHGILRVAGASGVEPLGGDRRMAEPRSEWNGLSRRDETGTAERSQNVYRSTSVNKAALKQGGQHPRASERATTG